MATSRIVSINDNLDYTFPDEILHKDMRQAFGELVSLCEVSKRIPITKYPSTEKGLLQPVLFADIVKACQDKEFLEEKKLLALAKKHWFFNSFIVPGWYDGDEFSHLPNIKLSWSEAIEVEVIYQNDKENPL